MDRSGQLSLFETDEEKEVRAFQVFSVKKTKGESLRCYEAESLIHRNLSMEELFSGFETIKAITFSYDIPFVEKVLSFVDYSEIILGVDYTKSPDESDINGLAAALYSNAEVVPKIIKKHKLLCDRMESDDAKFRIPKFALDHRKLYLLKSETGKTRVILGSANMSSAAWNGYNLETYTFTDDEESYETFESEFETAWQLSAEITPEVVAVTDDSKTEERNVFAREAKKTSKAVLMSLPNEVSDSMQVERTRIVLELNENKGKWLKGLNKAKINKDKGIFSIAPESIQKASRRIDSDKQREKKKTEIIEKEGKYPELTFDYTSETAFINGQEIERPSSEQVKQDIDVLLDVFNNFLKDFIGDTSGLQNVYYRMMSIMFSSPFHANLRCSADIGGASTDQLPLFGLTASKGSNSGKTFMAKVFLKMMSGVDLPILNNGDKETGVDTIRGIREQGKGMPFFVDEMNSKSFTHLEGSIKAADECEKKMKTEMPLVWLASNSIINPAEPIRKRMVFFKVNASLKTDIDSSEYNSKSRKILSGITDAFYREYLFRMLPKISEEMCRLESNTKEPGYYTDIAKISSETIIEIFKDLSVPCPKYIRQLSWYEDYDARSKHILNDGIGIIKERYAMSRKSFEVQKDRVLISFGADTVSDKIYKNCLAVLPPEFGAESQSVRDEKIISVLRDKLEEELGFKFLTKVEAIDYLADKATQKENVIRERSRVLISVNESPEEMIFNLPQSLDARKMERNKDTYISVNRKEFEKETGRKFKLRGTL